MSDILVINGHDYLPMRIRDTDTNRLWPLTCGHKHVTGDTIWYRERDEFDAYCTRCAADRASHPA